jgi:phage shock protein E
LRVAIVFFVSLYSVAQTATDEPEIWIDVRSVEEYQMAHIPSHPNIPHKQIAWRIGELAGDKNAPIRLYCRSGRRSGLARETLLEMGYTDVENRGGYDSVKAGLDALAAQCPKSEPNC